MTRRSRSTGKVAREVLALSSGQPEATLVTDVTVVVDRLASPRGSRSPLTGRAQCSVAGYKRTAVAYLGRLSLAATRVAPAS